jgi:hypothetical protein
MTLSRNAAFLVTGVAILIGSVGFVRAEVTLKGSLVCNGACMTNPNMEDHVMTLFVIDGTPEIRAELDRIVNDFGSCNQFSGRRGAEQDSQEFVGDRFEVVRPLENDDVLFQVHLVDTPKRP